MERDPTVIKSVIVGFDVLEPILRSGNQLSLREISNACGIEASRTHKYLASFCQVGLVRQDPGSGKYGLGRLSVEIGASAFSQLDAKGLARARLEDLMTTTGLTAALCVWNDSPVVVDVAVPRQALFAGVRIGARLPVWTSATGRIFLAFADGLEAEIPADGQSEIDDVRDQGVAVVKNSVMYGMSGASAPVFDHRAQASFALTLLGPSVEEIKTSMGALKRAAQDLSQDLGYVPK